MLNMKGVHFEQVSYLHEIDIHPMKRQTQQSFD